MSYISNADAAAIRTRFTAAAAPRPRDVSRLPAGVPVGPTLEVALFVATASFVSLFLCTGLAGLIL